MNFVGLDVRALDLLSFFSAAQLLSVLLIGAWLAWLWSGRGSVGVAPPVVLSLFAWAVTTYPLQRVYGLRVPSDRLRNLWWCATAAAGNPPWESGVVGQKTLEPAWSLLVSALSLWDPGLVVRIYPFLPALAIVVTGLSLAWAFRAEPEDAPDRTDGSLRVLLVLFFVLLASTQPLDFLGPFRNFWARHFMLKPNHALGLALVPVCVRTLCAPLNARRAAAAVFWLALLGWVFVLDWLLLCWGLLFYALLLWLRDRERARRELLPFGPVLAVLAAALVGPYVWSIARNFPAAVSLAPGNWPDDPLRSAWGDSPPRAHSLFFLATFDLGPLFFFALYGAWTAWRRGRRSDLLWLGLAAGAYAAWAANAWLYSTARARASDEIYWFLVFTMAIHAGLGVHRLTQQAAGALRGHPGLRPSGLSRPHRLTAAVLLLWLPFTLPCWWDPVQMDAHFRAALEPLPPWAVSLGEWFRAHTRGQDVVLAGQDVAVWIPALSGRRVLRTGRPWRASPAERDEQVILAPEDAATARATMDRLGVRYVVADASLMREHGLEPSQLARNPLLRESFRADGIIVYSLKD